MPITKVPIVHKFGIISHSQRVDLQDRLLQQSYLQSVQGTKQAQLTSRNPLEVTEDFINQFNAATTIDEKENLEDVAQRMLERIKRRSGLKVGGKGKHVDLPLAWTELSQLAQCKGIIQEDCLDVMITSLDQAPLQKDHIPALFFLAETTLYWLRTDAIHQPYLRSGEIKLLRMGQLVFTRLFYHHMAGQLQGHSDFKNRLFTYLDGLSESQDAYNPYPNALLSLRYIIEVGKIIIGDCAVDAGEVKEGDKMLEKPPDDFFTEVSVGFGSSTRSGALSSSVHDLSPTLWHALDVWRCANQLSGGLNEALHALEHCGLGLATESWIDGMCALQILADAAKSNVYVIRTLQNLTKGFATKIEHSHSEHMMGSGTYPAGRTDELSSPVHDDSKTTATNTTRIPLSDICEKTEDGTSTTRSTHRNLSHSSADPPSAQEETPTQQEESKPKSILKDTSHLSMENQDGGVKSDDNYLHPSRGITTPEKGRSSTGFGTVATAWQAEAGTEMASGRASQASSVPTYTNEAIPDIPGIHGWHWEVVVTYTDILSDICLHGGTSNIQKIALIGTNKDPMNVHKQPCTQPLTSAGLLDLVYFKAVREKNDGGPDDWSWRVRYSAIQGLVKVCRCCTGDSSKEGLRTVAWNTLIRAHSLESDVRVLEAYKVGQVDASIEKLLSKHLSVQPTSLGAHLADGLSNIYLPPLPPPVKTVPVKKPKPSERPQLSKSKPVQQKHLRTTLREEIMLATALYEPPVNFEVRASYDLKRIVEDQWRKDLQAQLEGEEEERLKELEEKRKKDEELETEKENLRRKKLGSKYKGPAYQF